MMEVFVGIAVLICWVPMSVPADWATLWLWMVSIAMVYFYCQLRFTKFPTNIRFI